MEEFEKKSVDDVMAWLEDKGFDEGVQRAFREQEMDGEAIMTAFAAQPGPDCLRDIIPTYGKRLKVYKALKEICMSQFAKERSPYSGTGASDDEWGSRGYSPLSSPLLAHRKSSFTETNEPQSSKSSVRSESTSSVRSQKRKGSFEVMEKVPNPFPIPTFRAHTQQNLDAKKLAADDRKYIVRVLATMLCTYVPRPSMKHCEIVAKSLVLKYAFLKEYYSWQQFLYTKCQNINRKPSTSSSNTPTKRLKVDEDKHLYPSVLTDMDDDIAHDRNRKLLKEEISKPKLRFDIAQELMRRTFGKRRRWILDGENLKTTMIVEEYPLLRKPLFVTNEFNLIMHMEDARDAFDNEWELWEPAIIEYACAMHRKPDALQSALQDKDCDIEQRTISALRCLGFFLTPKSKGKKSKSSEVQSAQVTDVPCILIQAPRGKPEGEVIDESNEQPHIVRLYDADSDIPAHYFIAIERTKVVECKTILSALFQLLAVHYVFNLEYHPKANDIMLFLQQNIMGIKDNCKKSAIYSNVTAAIECFVHRE